MHYPKWIFHKTEAPKIVNNEVEHEQAGEGWEETPAAFDQKSDEASKESTSDKTKTTGAALTEADFTKMKVAELKEYLISKGVEASELEGLKKDDLISMVGDL